MVNRLTLYEGNISQTASSLNINRSTLYRKLMDFKLRF
ncbi:helix-turn-helix domain-containing protein [Desulfosporosinus orientis]